MYQVSLDSGIKAETLKLLEKGQIRPSFHVLMKLDALGIPITQWAGVPIIAEAIKHRQTRKEMMAKMSARQSAWQHKARRKPNAPAYLNPVKDH
jgi:hypothetical protein